MIEKHAVHYSAEKDTWETPDEILDAMKRVWGSITLDPCTNVLNPTGATRFIISPDEMGDLCWRVVAEHASKAFTDEEARHSKHFLETLPYDGLAQDWNELAWGGLVFCNPPYGRVIKDWIAKAQTYDGPTVFLLPARTDTKWFHQLPEGVLLCFLEGRLKFRGAPASAPFPSILIGMNTVEEQFREAFGEMGLIT